MSEAVPIVACGALTPVGLDAASSAAAARAGISRVAEHPFMVDAAGAPVRCGRVPSVEPALFGPERLVALATGALHEAASALPLRDAYLDRAALFVALPHPRPGFTQADADFVARQLGSLIVPGVPRWDASAIATGHAAGLEALEQARACLARGEAELCFVAGVDSYLDADALDWLEANRMYAREGVRGAFLPGEAAGALALTDLAGCQRFGFEARAALRGVATGTEPRSLECDEGLLGEGLTDVVTRAARGLALPDERIDAIYCDLNGERHRADEWGFTAMRAWQVMRDATVYTTHVGTWGDIGAATAVVAAALYIESQRRRYGSRAPALVWGSSPHGLRGAAVLAPAEA